MHSARSVNDAESVKQPDDDGDDDHGVEDTLDATRHGDLAVDQ
jgi:hypothetical protein